MSLVSQWFFNKTAGESFEDSRERIVLIGGYGGWTKESDLFDGTSCRPDVWATNDGKTWSQLLANATFGPRAWHTSAVLTRDGDLRLDANPSTGTNSSARIFLFGGGNIGYSTSSSKKITSMEGRLDAWYSKDGVNW